MHVYAMRKATIRFDRLLQPWDGFGINYVEACQTRDYASSPQDYGGFGILSEDAMREIITLIFGDDGLRPGIAKMFLDPWHQAEPAAGYDFQSPLVVPDAYDHEATTQWMRRFIREGTALTRRRGSELGVITTLYGPPGWMTQQRFVRGRDLDPRFRIEMAKYFAAWVKFLREKEGLLVQAISLHNEGEDWMRWPLDGSDAGDPRHDYNLYWPPQMVVEFLSLCRSVLDANGLQDVLVSPGECTNWKRFQTWGYARAIADDPAALEALGLIVSHGFYSAGMQRWSADHRSAGVDLLRDLRPELHAWTTSTGWGREFLSMIWEIEQSIYAAKLNAYIPWAGVQRQALWKGGDPNPQTAILVCEDGTYRVQKEYHVYKHACRAGQPGMRVADFACNASEILVLAFGSNGSGHADAFVLANASSEAREIEVEVLGAGGGAPFQGWQTTEIKDWIAIGPTSLPGKIVLPARSVTSFSAPSGNPT
jgi:O-glycosyl hydrolase